MPSALADPANPSTDSGSSPAPTWRQVMKEAVRDPVELCRLLGLSADLAERSLAANGTFPLFAPRPYVARIRPGDPNDPLLRQVLPLDAEMQPVQGFTTDPVGDGAAELRPGLVQKYHGRVLIVTTGACAVHCRYCFRRHFPYDLAPKSVAAWEGAFRQIAEDASIDEVILSGGDPLTLVDPLLAEMADRLAEIPHLHRLRVHTRLPIVIPQRVTDEFLGWLCGTRLTPIVVVHANHPSEIDAEVAAALGRMVDAGVPVLNQAVLLRSVNDDVDTLAELCLRLVDLRVMPYYLHQLDRVAGAAHFEVPPQRGRAIINELLTRLPGYAVPKYVQEIAGERHKVLMK